MFLRPKQPRETRRILTGTFVLTSLTPLMGRGAVRQRWALVKTMTSRNSEFRDRCPGQRGRTDVSQPGSGWEEPHTQNKGATCRCVAIGEPQKPTQESGLGPSSWPGDRWQGLCGQSHRDCIVPLLVGGLS